MLWMHPIIIIAHLATLQAASFEAEHPVLCLRAEESDASPVYRVARFQRLAF